MSKKKCEIIEQLQAENAKLKAEILKLIREVVNATDGEYRKAENIILYEKRKKEWGL